MVTKTIQVAIAQNEVSREELRTDPFFRDILEYLSDQVLISLARDLYYAIDEHDWEVLGAYHASKDELIDRGYNVTTEPTGDGERVLVITGPKVQIPF